MTYQLRIIKISFYFKSDYCKEMIWWNWFFLLPRYKAFLYSAATDVPLLDRLELKYVSVNYSDTITLKSDIHNLKWLKSGQYILATLIIWTPFEIDIIIWHIGYRSSYRPYSRYDIGKQQFVKILAYQWPHKITNHEFLMPQKYRLRAEERKNNELRCLFGFYIFNNFYYFACCIFHWIYSKSIFRERNFNSEWFDVFREELHIEEMELPASSR